MFPSLNTHGSVLSVETQQLVSPPLDKSRDLSSGKLSRLITTAFKSTNSLNSDIPESRKLLASWTTRQAVYLPSHPLEIVPRATARPDGLQLVQSACAPVISNSGILLCSIQHNAMRNTLMLLHF